MSGTWGVPGEPENHPPRGVWTRDLNTRTQVKLLLLKTVLKFVFVVLYCKLRLFACSKLAKIDFFYQMKGFENSVTA